MTYEANIRFWIAGVRNCLAVEEMGMALFPDGQPMKGMDAHSPGLIRYHGKWPAGAPAMELITPRDGTPATPRPNPNLWPYWQASKRTGTPVQIFHQTWQDEHRPPSGAPRETPCFATPPFLDADKKVPQANIWLVWRPKIHPAFETRRAVRPSIG